MCYFITLILPTDDADAVEAVMLRHGRSAEPIDNPSLRAVLNDGERQYLTATSKGCDCGSVLGCPPDTPEEMAIERDKAAARLKRKGWSWAKIDRAMSDHDKASARPNRTATDSIDLWSAVLDDFRDALGLRQAGLFMRNYSGAIATDSFIATRRDFPANSDQHVALTGMAQAEASIFRLA